MSAIHGGYEDELRTGIKALIGTVTYAGVTYTVFKKNLPKPAPDTYIRIGEILSNEDGTKDDFVYYGSVYIHVVDESGFRPGKSLAYELLGVLRGLLKPTITTVPTVTGRTVTKFAPSGYNEIEETDVKTRVQLTEIYDFIIE